MDAPICASMGAMFNLPRKLHGLLRHVFILPKGAEDEIPLIKGDLEEIITILQELKSREEDPAMMVICWMKEVRELSYDMDDCIDQYDHAADFRSRSVGRNHYRQITRRKSKTTHLPQNLKLRLWMANKIREFSWRVQEALHRYHLFNIGSISTASTKLDESFVSWHPTIYGERADDPVGVKKLEAWLSKDGVQNLKVVSIVGFGGIGKTTLANELYCRIGKQFSCSAFVRASQKPDIRRLLISMLSQVRPHKPPDSCEVHSLISDIRTHLQDKRYLIVIEDVWATSTWDIISCALPDSNCCSGVLITTEIEDLALRCCSYDSKYVFMMKPLDEDDSEKLFFSKAFGGRQECPVDLSDASKHITSKCGGLPLAIVTVASLLARWTGKPERWDYVNKSLGYDLKTNPTLDGIKKLLNLSYVNLPQHLKACMLYLSMYQEDHIIWKDDLVRQWISEGFICAAKGKDKEEIARSYFDYLISRRMIQPGHINKNDEVLSCIVHHMVLNFIRQKSIEENFVTAIDYSQKTAKLADKVRRLSLYFGNAKDPKLPTNFRLTQVRTLTFFGVFKCMPSIMEFRLLQVLILHFWSDEKSIKFDLRKISEFFRLRYLQVICNVNLELGTQMRGLQCLKTLKLDARVCAVPSDIVCLAGLLHLSLPLETNFPNGIGHMRSLRKLAYFNLSSNSMDNVQSLGKLTNLHDLQLTCATVPSGNLESNMEIMSSILGKLNNLKSLTLEPSSILDVGPSSMSISCDRLSSVSSPPALLQKLDWLPRICTFCSLPKWIGHLSKLCILKIGVRELSRNDVDVLRGLPVLSVLSLYVHTKLAEKVVLDRTGFSVLKYFKFKCSIPWIKFDVAALPNLKKLKLGFDAHGLDQHGAIPVGMVHLSSLKEISAKIGGADVDEQPDRRSVESALSNAIRMHPGRPTINIQWVDQMFGGKDTKNRKIEEVEYRTVQKQYEIVEENSSKQHGVLRKDVREDANRNVHGRFSTLLEREILLLLVNKLEKHQDDIDRLIPVVDVYSIDPWQLPEVGTKDGEPWLYFCTQQWWEATGSQPSRTTPSGYWKAVDTPGLVYSADSRPIGTKNTMVFYLGRAPSGNRTKWNMNEYWAFRSTAAGTAAGSKSISSIQATTLPNLSQQRSEISLCQLYTKPDSPACLLQEEEQGALEQYKITNKDSNEQDGVILNYSEKEANKQAKKRRRALPIWCTQVRVVSSTNQDQPPDDGFMWRKYGQKDFLHCKYPRSYYSCIYQNTHGCSARKKVQRTDNDPLLFDVVYSGNHTGHLLPQLGQDQNSVSVGVSASAPATSERQDTYQPISSSVSGVCFESPVASRNQGQMTNEAVGSRIGSVRATTLDDILGDGDEIPSDLLYRTRGRLHGKQRSAGKPF